MKTKILLDTDIGSDIDDAVCLAYLLAQPDCDLLGITTVTGESKIRAMVASALCKAAGKDIPIYPGAIKPLVGVQKQPEVPQAAGLERWEHETIFPEGSAVEFMQSTIRANPGEVILLPIGPLTNIATLFRDDPAIPGMLKGLVLMCGIFTDRFTVEGQAEWNARLDPEATDIVYRANPTMHRSIGLDVTLKTALDDRNIRQRFDTPLLRPVLDFAEIWFEHAEKLIFHDPLAAATIFDDQICRFERGNVRVDLESRPGRTCWEPVESGRHEVAIEVDVDRFYRHYFSTFETP